MEKLFKRLYLIGPVLFLVVLSSIGIKNIVEVFLSANPSFIVLGISLVPLDIILRSEKLRLIVITNSKFSLTNAIKAQLIEVAYNSVTPGGVGGFAKVMILQKLSRLNFASCFSWVLIDKWWSLITLITLSNIGLIISMSLFDHTPVIILWLFFGFLLFELILLSMLIMPSTFYKIANWSIKQFGPRKLKQLLTYLISDLYGNISDFTSKNNVLWKVLVLSFLTWFVYLIRMYLYAQALHIDAPFWAFVFIFPVVSLIEILPISIMGIGSRDIVLVMLFPIWGIDRAQAVSLSLLSLSLLLLTETIAGFIVAHKERLGVSMRHD